MTIAGSKFAVIVWALTGCLFSGVALAQTAKSPTEGWSGSAKCEVKVQGAGYSDRQLHTWTMAGGTPKVEGAFRVYPATWTDTGEGSFQRTQGNQTLSAQWTTNAPGMDAPIGVFLRASDGKLIISSRHAQLRARNAITGEQRQTVDGKPRTPTPIGLEAFEFSFPVVEGTSKTRTISGTSTPAVTGNVGPMQPAGATATASCSWKFSR